MTPSEFYSPTRIVWGPGRIAELGKLARSLGVARRVLLVSDAGVASAGHTERGRVALEAAGFESQLFDQFSENPTTDHVEAGLDVARRFAPELIVGLGGGSSMDCAKGVNFLYSCGGKMSDYWGIGKATGPLLPMIAVPTTAGTGSEAQSFALISDATTKRKMACGDKRAAFCIALLDPELTLTQPHRVAAVTGFDALSHAVETAVTSARTPFSAAYSREAWRRIAPNFLRVLRHPDDLEARAQMQLGACLAGLAIEASMLGAGHALANPLTAMFDITHGEAVALMLPAVVRFNGRRVAPLYADFLASASGDHGTPRPGDGPEELADFLRTTAIEAGLAVKLSDRGVTPAALDALSASAAQQWTASFNPVPLEIPEIRRLYEATL